MTFHQILVSMEHMQPVWHADRGRLLLRTPGPVPFGICKCSFVETTETPSYITPPIHDPFPDLTSYRIWHLSLIWHHQFMTLSQIRLLTEFDITDYWFPWGICNGCGMPTGDAYSSGHLVLFLWGLAFVLFVETREILYRLDIIPVCDITALNIFTEYDISPNIGFHGAYATGVACRQGTLTPPDTWSCPTLGLACVLMSRPISPELVLSPDFWISNTPRYFSFAPYTPRHFPHAIRRKNVRTSKDSARVSASQRERTLRVLQGVWWRLLHPMSCRRSPKPQVLSDWWSIP